MNYLVVHPSPEVQREQLTALLRQHVPHIDSETILKHTSADVWQLDPEDKNTIGIEEIKELLSHLRFRPTHLPFVVGIIWNAERLTVPAQNALLKDLEDRSGNWLFVMLTKRLGSIVPTIRSRCQVIVPKSSHEEEAVQLSELGESLYRHLHNRSDRVGAFLAIQQAAEKTAIPEMQLVLHKLAQGYNLTNLSDYARSAHNLAVLQEAYQSLARNANKRLTLEHVWLRLKT